MKRRTIAAAILVGLTGAVWLNNSSLLSVRAAGKPVLLAHRGLAQDYDRTDLASDTCTAKRMQPPRHGFLENTIASMDAAFALGADVIEFDVHPTADGRFAVFHDWTLDCRTEGTGRTRDHSLDELKALDVGYGYTADGGVTYPFRGKGVGQMPALDEVLDRFPDKRFHINVKSNDPGEGIELAAYLATLAPPARARLTIVGGERPIAEIEKALPDQRTVSREKLVRCMTRSVALGWTGHVPGPCRDTALLLPVNFAPWLWGWPDRLLDRMESANTPVYLLGPYSGGFSVGLDDPALIDRLPPGYSGGISTDAPDQVLLRLGARS